MIDLLVIVIIGSVDDGDLDQSCDVQTLMKVVRNIFVRNLVVAYIELAKQYWKGLRTLDLAL